MKKTLALFLSIFIFGNILGQEESIKDFDQEYVDWFNKDLDNDKILGASIDKVYNTLLKGKVARKTVIVAVIDGGVDIYHKDLEGKIWVNEDEIPNNNIDDDNNGYVDDIHGWNFIGNMSGENVIYENLEYTRILKANDNNDKNYQKKPETRNLKLTSQSEHSPPQSSLYSGNTKISVPR